MEQELLKKITQQLLSSDKKITLEDGKEWADTVEVEIGVGIEGAKQAIIKHRKKRESDHKARTYYAKIQAGMQFPKYSFEELYSAKKRQYPNFVLDQYSEPNFSLLCMYFSGSEKMLEAGYSLNKGLCLMGGVGVGKTTLMRMFVSNQVQSFLIRSSRELANDFAKHGYAEIEKYYGTLTCENFFFDPYNFNGHKELGICFDDLGSENTTKNYGNETSVVSEIILSRYDKLNMNRNMTHITTNLLPDEIEKKYGTRVMDRIKEMFNCVVYPGNTPSRRK